jgi:hypothetical protein
MISSLMCAEFDLIHKLVFRDLAPHDEATCGIMGLGPT